MISMTPSPWMIEIASSEHSFRKLLVLVSVEGTSHEVLDSQIRIISVQTKSAYGGSNSFADV